MSRLRLEFGQAAVWEWEPAAGQVMLTHAGPATLPDLRGTLQAALKAPLEFPPLTQALVPGDRLVLALDRGVPQAASLIAALWEVLSGAGVEPTDVTILQPGTWRKDAAPDPRSLLPAEVRSAMRWERHDPTDEARCGYLATSAGGERIYLARTLLDADYVLPITTAGFDPLLGYRSPMASLYPGLSNAAAIAKALGQGHRELRPQDERPLRQLVDEAGWLLGVQTVLQVLPAGPRGGIAEVYFGSAEAVGRASETALDEAWRVTAPERYETVVLSIPTADRSVGWDDLGAALATARNLVAASGKVVVLTDLKETPGPGIELLRGQGDPRSAQAIVRQAGPPDLLGATTLAEAADWARIYLHSPLDADLVEELFMVPLASVAEAGRLLEGEGAVAVLSAGQFVHAEIADET